jgi:hypothetical protein
MKKISLTALCVFALLALGCGKEPTVSTPAGDVKVTTKGDATTFEMKSKDDKVNVTIAGSDKGVALPDKFPSDIPVMPGAIVKVAMVTGEGMSVQFGVKSSQADAVKFYEENFKAKGWTIEATMNTGASSMMSAKKDKRECVLNIVPEGAGSIVQVLVSSEKG